MRRPTGTAGLPVCLLGWAASRLPLIGIVLGALPYRWPQTITGDLRLYAGWAAVLGQGRFPVGDWNWQYPPGAALAVLPPAWLPGGYLGGFLTVAVAADAAVLALLLRLGRRDGGSPAGAWAWVAGIPLLGPLAYARYDLLVAAVAVAALAVAARPVVSGALIGLGAMLKVWPVLLLVGAPRLRGAVAGAVGAAALLAGALAVLLPGSLDFLAYQRGRGVQIESVPGTVFLVGRHLGWDGTNELRYGAREWTGSGVDTVRLLAPLLTVAAFGWLALWRRRAAWGPATPYDAALTAVLLAVVTSRVLSPQYLIWLVALAAVCLASRGTGQRSVALLVLGCTALTQLEFPVLWSPLVAGFPADLVLLARNAALVVAAVWSARALWRSTDPAPAPDRGRPRLAGSRGRLSISGATVRSAGRARPAGPSGPA